MQALDKKKAFFRRSKLKVLKLTKNIYGYAVLKDIEDSTIPNVKDIQKERSLKCVNNFVNKVMIGSRLGPGFYSNNTPKLSPSSSFSSIPRFLNTPEEKFAIRRMKTPKKSFTRQNVSGPELKKSVSDIALKDKKIMKNFEIKIAKETKRIIEKEINDKRVQVLSAKIELPMFYTPKPSPSKTSLTWCKLMLILTYLGIFTSILNPRKRALFYSPFRESKISKKKSTSSFN